MYEARFELIYIFWIAKKKRPEGALKAQICNEKSQLNTIHLPYKHDPNNMNRIHVWV